MYKFKHWLMEVFWRQKLPVLTKKFLFQLSSPISLFLILLFAVAILSGFRLDDLFKSELNQLNEEVVFSVDKPYKAPGFRVENWLNTNRKPASDDPVQVVVFWNASCLSCHRVLPHVQDWSDKYDEDGLSVLTVHTPEFSFETSPQTVRAAANELGLEVPIALDNDFKITDAFANESAPAMVFIDQNKRVRHVVIGEGGYSHSERIIQALLREYDSDLRYEKPRSGPADEPHLSFLQTSDMYVGHALSDAFANVNELSKDKVAIYHYRIAELNEFSLEGEWLVKAASIRSFDNARMHVHFTAKDLYIVMGAEEGSVVTVELGEGLRPGRDIINGNQVVARDEKIYHLATADQLLGDARVVLKLPPGVEIYKVYFGG